MGVDLFLLAAIGCVLEGVVTALSGFVFNGTPTFTFSLLIIYLAVVRWNLWGLLLAPILVLATILGGSLGIIDRYAAVYDWRVYISSTLGLITAGLNVIFFKRFGTRKVINATGMMIILVLVNYLTYSLVSFLTYRLICAGTLAHSGVLEFVYNIYEEGNTIQTSVNLCAYVESAFVYNLFGLAVAIIGLFVLRSQGVVNNVIDKLVEDKKNAELDRIAESNFTFNIQEEAKTEESNDTSDSSAN